jgi:spore coat polysaccharide biosynthesis protein SpsF
MRKVALIQARMDSSRLPGKVMLPLAGRASVLHVVERLQHASHIDHIVVATAEHASNDQLFALCQREGIDCYRGSLPDVLQRLAGAARHADAEIVARVTCDCPLIETEFIDQRLATIEKENCDLTYCLTAGMIFAGASVMTAEFLYRLDREITDTSDREHGGLPYARRNRHLFNAREVLPNAALNAYNFRLAVDELADYELVSTIYDELYKPGRPIPIWDVIRYLEERPELSASNRHVQQTKVNDRPLTESETL